MKSLDVLRGVLLALFLLMSLFVHFYGSYLTRYRRDLRPGQNHFSGRSWIMAWNLLNPKNYDDRGRALLKWLYLAVLVQLGTVMFWVYGMQGL